jgi:hypothetical protein
MTAEHIEVRPPQASRAGKNRYYITCDKVGHSRHYGICLFTLEAFERGQKLTEEPCVKAMIDGTCPALKMRQEELDAGHAIYYIEPDPKLAIDPKDAQRERNAVSHSTVNRNSPSYLRGFNGPSAKTIKTVAPAPTPVAKKPAHDGIVEFDASKLVNKILTDEKAGPTEDEIKQQMLNLGRPAALRRRKAAAEGKTLKSSVFDYLTAAELKQMNQLKRQLVAKKMEPST